MMPKSETGNYNPKLRTRRCDKQRERCVFPKSKGSIEPQGLAYGGHRPDILAADPIFRRDSSKYVPRSDIRRILEPVALWITGLLILIVPMTGLGWDLVFIAPPEYEQDPTTLLVE